MSNKKYELTDEIKIICGRTLQRIFFNINKG